MTDLSHWVFAKDFTAHEAAYLILGADPSKDTGLDSQSSRHVFERMREAYEGALENLKFQFFVEPCISDSWFDEGEHERMSAKATLISVKIESLSENFQNGDEVSTTAWLEQGSNDFREQRFSRSELARWIADNQFVTHYPFTQKFNSVMKENVETQKMQKIIENHEHDILLKETVESNDIDPLDLPKELDAANVAYRAVLNGYGNKSATFRNRLIDYLEKNCSELNNEAVQRIATVANPDKGRGRKKRNSV